VSDPAPDVKATRRLIFGGGSHEVRLATSAGAAGYGRQAIPVTSAAKHPHSLGCPSPSQPTPRQQIQQDDHHRDPEHPEGRKQHERHRASNTTLLVLADTAWRFFRFLVTRAQRASNAEVSSGASAYERPGAPLLLGTWVNKGRERSVCCAAAGDRFPHQLPAPGHLSSPRTPGNVA
jgi:hypothetical protein